ncbi:MAG: ABC transporter permease, partial [Rhodoblastus sp.]|nr:ABC transporter permease [Rhodoblastus sp.]
MSRSTLLAWQVGVAAALLAIWHIGSSVSIFGIYFMPKFFFSTPADVLGRVWKMFATGIVWKHLWITLTETALAFVIGSVTGAGVGFWFARNPKLAAIFDPFLKA